MNILQYTCITHQSYDDFKQLLLTIELTYQSQKL